MPVDCGPTLHQLVKVRVKIPDYTLYSSMYSETCLPLGLKKVEVKIAIETLLGHEQVVFRQVHGGFTIIRLWSIYPPQQMPQVSVINMEKVYMHLHVQLDDLDRLYMLAILSNPCYVY